MKKSNKIYCVSVATAILIAFSVSVKAQKWRKDQPSTLFAEDKKQNVSGVNVGIGTKTPQFPLDVRGQIQTDSLKVASFLNPKNSSGLE